MKQKLSDRPLFQSIMSIVSSLFGIAFLSTFLAEAPHNLIELQTSLSAIPSLKIPLLNISLTANFLWGLAILLVMIGIPIGMYFTIRRGGLPHKDVVKFTALISTITIIILSASYFFGIIGRVPLPALFFVAILFWFSYIEGKSAVRGWKMKKMFSDKNF